MQSPVRRVVILGAAGRDFHDFNTVFRDKPDCRVVAFTATQIPGIDGRRYPASLAGSLYPDGIPIVAEDELEGLIRRDRPGCEVHDLRVRHVRVREDAEVDILAADQALELVLGDDGDAVRVERSGEGCGIAPSVDARDLRRGEGDDPAVGLVPENRVEVVEIAGRRAQNYDTPHGALHGNPPAGRAPHPKSRAEALREA